MSATAPKEIQGLSSSHEKAKIVHIPAQEGTWRNKVVHHLRNLGHPVTTKEVTPAANRPIAQSHELKQVNAVRVGEEPDFSTADIKHFLDTAGTIVSGENPDSFHRTTKGSNILRLMLGRENKRSKA